MNGVISFYQMLSTALSEPSGLGTSQNQIRSHTNEMLSSRNNRNGKLQLEYLVLSFLQGMNLRSPRRS